MLLNRYLSIKNLNLLLKTIKKKIQKEFFFFSSTELKPELLTTDCIMQKQSAIKLSHKVAQSTSIFIDKYRSFDKFSGKKKILLTHPNIYIHIYHISKRYNVSKNSMTCYSCLCYKFHVSCYSFERRGDQELVRTKRLKMVFFEKKFFKQFLEVFSTTNLVKGLKIKN